MTVSCSTHPTHPRYIDNGYVQLISVIGNGAYGVVFYALDYRYGVPIKRAVKQLHRHGIDERQRRFQIREIELHSRASAHSSIIHMDRLIEEHDCIYVVMDYGDEGDLFAMITEKQRYAGDNELIRDVFLQILDGIDWLHSLGIAHRDVKPENIVCSHDGTRVRIVDFGLATSEDKSSEFGCGSTFYIAPECLGEWNHKATSYPTRSADVWSLGVILVNLVCGRNPWRCASPTDESFEAFLKDPMFLRHILPISHNCLSILQQIFTLDPKNRITLDRLRQLILEIDSFTEDLPASPVRKTIPKETYYNDEYLYDEDPVPALKADIDSPLQQSSSQASSSEDIFPSTPRITCPTSHPDIFPGLSGIVYDPLSTPHHKVRPGHSPVPFVTPAMFP